MFIAEAADAATRDSMDHQAAGQGSAAATSWHTSIRAPTERPDPRASADERLRLVRRPYQAATRAVAVGPLTTLCNLGPNLELGLRFW